MIVGLATVLALVGGQVSPSDGEILRKVDTLLAVRPLASGRAVYLAERRSGAIRVRRSSDGIVVAFGPPIPRTDRPSHSVEFDSAGGLRSIGFPVREIGEAVYRPTVEPTRDAYRNAAAMVRAITGESRVLDVRESMVDEEGRPCTLFRAYRSVAGRPILGSHDEIGVTGRNGERFWTFGTGDSEDEIDGTTYGGGAKGTTSFRYFLETDRIEVVVPPSGQAPYADLAARKIGIPVYHRDEWWPSEPGGDLGRAIFLDARNGRRIGWGGGRGRQGGYYVRAGLLSTVMVGGVAGELVPLSESSFTPPGRRVEIPVGSTVFVARFEPGRGTLWVREERDRPFRAYRPSFSLRKVLTTQARAADLGRERTTSRRIDSHRARTTAPRPALRYR